MGFVSVLLLVGLLYLGYKHYVLHKKYKPIRDLEREILKKQRIIRDKTEEVETLNKSIDSAQKEFEDKEEMLKLLEDRVEYIESGFYKSKYNLEDSDSYKAKLERIRINQKQKIKEKTAIICTAEWRVGDSLVEGRKMTDRTIRLGLSAFNVQCDNEIMKVNYSNVNKAEEKLEKIKDNINKLLEPNRCHITQDFFKLKLEELFLVHEYQEILQKEKEEQRLIREQMKEEEKALREAQKAQDDAEKEEKTYKKALEKAKEDLEKSKSDNNSLYLDKIKELELKLLEAQMQKERAKSQAEQTKKGHVYIISNLGSFGENVYKIGMTRRLDPMDRVWELGDASVPFEFDVHAMIHSDNAPELERTLHKKFHDYRVNKINERKEFFKISLGEIEKACREHVPEDKFKITLLAEAKEYKQTLLKK